MENIGFENELMGLMDVYDNGIEKKIDEAIVRNVAKYKNNHWLIGYFIGNEPAWISKENRLCSLILNGKDRPIKIELQNFLKESVDSGTRIVFTTAFDQYAIDGYKVNALDYLLKPISYVDFLQAANKAVQWFELLQQSKEEIQSIFVKSEYKLVQIELSKILYIEGLKDYLKIYEEDSPKPILSLMSMKAMEELLPASRFMRVHRSYIVQKNAFSFL